MVLSEQCCAGNATDTSIIVLPFSREIRMARICQYVKDSMRLLSVFAIRMETKGSFSPVDLVKEERKRAMHWR
jgi:hypothetical protein